MTALTSHEIPTTSLDRTLLYAASALDRCVAARMERRGASARTAAAVTYDDARTAAQALGGIGMMPR